MQSLNYPAQITPNGEGGFIVSFVDVREARAEGWSMAEAMKNAQDALISAAEFYVKDGRDFPMPSAQRADDVMIKLPLCAVSDIRLLENMPGQEVHPAD